MKRFSRKLARIALLLFVLCLLAPASTATTVVMLSDEEMVVNSRFILSGEVRSITSAWDDSQNMIWTYVEVETERFYKGEIATKKIVLKQAGGAVGGEGIHVFGQPNFNPGQKVLLYLTTAPDGSLRVAYSFMGMYSILEDSSGRKIVSRAITPDGVQILSHQNQEPATDRADFQEHIQNIKQTLRDKSDAIEQKQMDWAAKPVWSIPAEYERKKAEVNVPGLQFVLVSGGIRWMEPDSGQPVRFSLNSARSPVGGGGSAEIQRAMSAWSSASGIRLQVGGQTSNCGHAADNINTISYGDCLGQLDPASGCSGVVAQTSMRWNNETRVVGGVTFRRLTESDVVFNDGMDCFLGNSANLAEVACHELGHAIGLAHSGDSSAVMWPSAHGNGRDASLGSDDRAGIQAIYPSGAGGGGGTGGGGTGGGGTGGGTGGGGGGENPNPVSITILSLSDGVVGKFYKQVLNASGGQAPYQWTLNAGRMPSGLRLTTAGLIEGTPTQTGIYSLVFQVADSSGFGTNVATKRLSLTVRSEGDTTPPTPRITNLRVKGLKKLFIYGSNFNRESVVLLNGTLIEPTQYSVENGADRLLVKKKLNLRASGQNELQVINNGVRSEAVTF